MGITQIIGVLTTLVGIPGLLPSKHVGPTIALVTDAYNVYNAVEGHLGAAVIAARAQQLFTDLEADGVSLGAFGAAFAKVGATISNYESGQLAVLDSNVREFGASSAGKVYAVKDGGDAAGKIDKLFYQGYDLVPPSTPPPAHDAAPEIDTSTSSEAA